LESVHLISLPSVSTQAVLRCPRPAPAQQDVSLPNILRVACSSFRKEPHLLGIYPQPKSLVLAPPIFVGKRIAIPRIRCSAGLAWAPRDGWAETGRFPRFRVGPFARAHWVASDCLHRAWSSRSRLATSGGSRGPGVCADRERQRKVGRALFQPNTARCAQAIPCGSAYAVVPCCGEKRSIDERI